MHRGNFFNYKRSLIKCYTHKFKTQEIMKILSKIKVSKTGSRRCRKCNHLPQERLGRQLKHDSLRMRSGGGQA